MRYIFFKPIFLLFIQHSQTFLFIYTKKNNTLILTQKYVNFKIKITGHKCTYMYKRLYILSNIVDNQLMLKTYRWIDTMSRGLRKLHSGYRDNTQRSNVQFTLKVYGKRSSVIILKNKFFLLFVYVSTHLREFFLFLFYFIIIFFPLHGHINSYLRQIFK